jgi:hypothetical protein
VYRKAVIGFLENKKHLAEQGLVQCPTYIFSKFHGFRDNYIKDIL